MAGGGGVPRFLRCLEPWRLVNEGGTWSELGFLKFPPNWKRGDEDSESQEV